MGCSLRRRAGRWLCAERRRSFFSVSPCSAEIPLSRSVFSYGSFFVGLSCVFLASLVVSLYGLCVVNTFFVCPVEFYIAGQSINPCRWVRFLDSPQRKACPCLPSQLKRKIIPLFFFPRVTLRRFGCFSHSFPFGCEDKGRRARAFLFPDPPASHSGPPPRLTV